MCLSVSFRSGDRWIILPLEPFRLVASIYATLTTRMLELHIYCTDFCDIDLLNLLLAR